MRVEVRPTSTPFLRLNGRMGWSAGPEATRTAIPFADRDLVLARKGREPIAMGEPFGSFGGRTLPRGLAISNMGQMFLAAPGPANRDDAGVILTAFASEFDATPPEDADAFWPFKPLWAARPSGDIYSLDKPSDIALSPNGDLVITDSAQGRILVVTLPDGAIRQDIRLGSGSTPSSLAFDAAGACYVADRGLVTIHRFGVTWRKDDAFPHASSALVLPEFVAAIAGDGDCQCGCVGACGCPQPAKGAPVVAVLDKSMPVLLDVSGRRVERDVFPDLSPPALQIEDTGLSWTDPTFPGRAPLQFKGLMPDRRGQFPGTGFALIARPRRANRPRFGEIVLGPFDSGAVGFRWDRIALDADLPETGRLVLSTLTTEQALERDRLETVPQTRWSMPLAINPGDRPEILIQSSPGRFLYLKIALSGDGSDSPVISEIDIFGPRRSALRFLPAPFHADQESAHFLDRFLRYFDVIFEEVERENQDIARLFDPQAVPEGAPMDWLGRWFDLEFPASWPAQTRRDALAQVSDLHPERGTIAGLKRVLQWHTGLQDPMPQVVEHFRFDPSNPARIGGTDLNTGKREHRVTIVLPAEYLATADDQRVIERLIEEQIPAHVHYQLLPIKAELRIGEQSTLGVDTLIGLDAPQALGEARLGESFGPAPSITGPVGPALSSSSQGDLSC